MVSVLRTLQAEWNALVPTAQALNVRRVRHLNDPLETIEYRRNKLEWLRGEIARLSSSTILTAHAAVGDISIYTFGVEIEFVTTRVTRDELAAKIRQTGVSCNSEHYNHTTGHAWKIVTDASVDSSYSHGFEIVSPILRGDDGFSQLKRVCDVLRDNGCKVSKKCGFHVHVGASDWHVETFKNLALLYKSAEASIDSFMAPSRRASANGYCRSLMINAARMTAAQTMDAVAQAIHQTPGRANSRNSSRYYKLNFQSFWQHGTVEFRHHQGTIEADKAINWTKLCLRMCLAAQEGTRAAETFDALFAVVKADPAEKNFFKGRADFFAAQLSRSVRAEARRNENLARERNYQAQRRQEMEDRRAMSDNPFAETGDDLARRSTTRSQY